jgi:hypothetical protein
MVIAATVSTTRQALESMQVELALKRRKLGHFEKPANKTQQSTM